MQKGLGLGLGWQSDSEVFPTKLSNKLLKFIEKILPNSEYIGVVY